MAEKDDLSVGPSVLSVGDLGTIGKNELVSGERIVIEVWVASWSSSLNVRVRLVARPEIK